MGYVSHLNVVGTSCWVSQHAREVTGSQSTVHQHSGHAEREREEVRCYEVNFFTVVSSTPKKKKDKKYEIAC